MSALAWGGLANGHIPEADLHPIASFKPLEDGWASEENGSHMMRADAAIQLSGLQRAFFEEFGEVLHVREAYRSIAGQDWYYNRMMNHLPGWTLAAFPGTSIHGWALSVDLGVGEANANPSGVYLAWLLAHSVEWGFRNDVPRESWHWSFITTYTRVVTQFIADPTTGATAAPSTTQEDDMGMRLIRNNTKGSANYGSTEAICIETGFYRHLGSNTTVKRFEATYKIATEQLSATVWSYWIGVAKDHRALMAKTAANLFPYPTPPEGLTAAEVWKEHRIGDGSHSADYYLSTAGATAEAIAEQGGLDALLDAIAKRVTEQLKG